MVLLFKMAAMLTLEKTGHCCKWINTPVHKTAVNLTINLNLRDINNSRKIVFKRQFYQTIKQRMKDMSFLGVASGICVIISTWITKYVRDIVLKRFFFCVTRSKFLEWWDQINCSLPVSERMIPFWTYNRSLGLVL